MDTTLYTTPRDLIRHAVTRFNKAKLFFGHGSAEAYDEAAYLTLHTLALPLDRLEPFMDARLKCSRHASRTRPRARRMAPRIIPIGMSV